MRRRFRPPQVKYLNNITAQDHRRTKAHDPIGINFAGPTKAGGRGDDGNDQKGENTEYRNSRHEGSDHRHGRPVSDGILNHWLVRVDFAIRQVCNSSMAVSWVAAPCRHPGRSQRCRTQVGRRAVIADQIHIVWLTLCSPSILSTCIPRGIPRTRRGMAAGYLPFFGNKRNRPAGARYRCRPLPVSTRSVCRSERPRQSDSHRIATTSPAAPFTLEYLVAIKGGAWSRESAIPKDERAMRHPRRSCTARGPRWWSRNGAHRGPAPHVSGSGEPVT